MVSKNSSPDGFADITDRFEIVTDEHLVYVDGPLEGFLRESATGTLFAFRCRETGPRIFQWTLLPVPRPGLTPESCFSMAADLAEGSVGVFEDARTSPKRLFAIPLGPGWLTRWSSASGRRPSYVEVIDYIRGFTNAQGDPAPCDLIGLFQFALAAFDNLARHKVPADIDDLAAAMTEEQRLFLLELADALRDRQPDE